MHDIQMDISTIDPVAVSPDPPLINIVALICNCIEELTITQTHYNETHIIRLSLQTVFP